MANAGSAFAGKQNRGRYNDETNGVTTDMELSAMKLFVLKVGRTNLKIFIMKGPEDWELIACTGRIENGAASSQGMKEVWEQGDGSEHVEPGRHHLETGKMRLRNQAADEMEVDVKLYQVEDFE